VLSFIGNSQEKWMVQPN